MTMSARSSSPFLGRLGVAFGVAALAAIAWLALLSFTSFGPPDVVRFLGALFLPIGIGGAIGVAIAERRGPGRRLALIGLGLAGLAVVGLVVMQLAAGY